MRLIRKLYWIAVAVMMAAGLPYEGSGDFISTLSFYTFLGLIFLYAAPKILRIGASAKRSGYRSGLRSTMIGGLQRGTSRTVTNFMMGNGGSPSVRTNDAWARKQEAKQQAFDRWQANEKRANERYRLKKEAGFQDYQARRYAGTNFGSQAANRAQAARNKARNL